MILLLKEICHLCEKIAAAAQRSNFNHIVTSHMKKCSTPNKRKSECRNSGMHPNNAAVDPIDSPQKQQTTLFPVLYDSTLFSKNVASIFCIKMGLPFFTKWGCHMILNSSFRVLKIVNTLWRYTFVR